MAGNSYDRIKTPYESNVKSVFPNIDFMTLYEAKVISQSSDLLSVDIQPTDNDLPGMNNIPIRIGVAGITIKLIPNALVMLGFNGGSPSGAYVTSFKNEHIEKIIITDIANDTLTMTNGGLVFKSGGVTLLDVSMTAVKLYTVGSIPILNLGSTDSLGVPVTQLPGSTNLVLGG